VSHPDVSTLSIKTSKFYNYFCISSKFFNWKHYMSEESRYRRETSAVDLLGFGQHRKWEHTISIVKERRQLTDSLIGSTSCYARHSTLVVEWETTRLSVHLLCSHLAILVSLNRSIAMSWVLSVATPELESDPQRHPTQHTSGSITRIPESWLYRYAVLPLEEKRQFRTTISVTLTSTHVSNPFPKVL